MSYKCVQKTHEMPKYGSDSQRILSRRSFAAAGLPGRFYRAGIEE